MTISEAFDESARARGVGVLTFNDDKPSAVIGSVSPPTPIIPPLDATYLDAVLFDNPMYYARMDDLVPSAVCVDIISARNGAYQNSPLLEGRGALALQYNQSVYFNSALSQHVNNVGLVSDFSFIQNTGIFTIEFWFRLEDLLADYYISANANLISEKGFLIRYVSATKKLRFEILNGSGASSMVTLETALDVIGQGMWHNVVITGDGVNAVIYVDNIQKITGALGVSSSGDSSFPLILGAGNSSGSGFGFLLGDLDEYSISNATLTQLRVTAHYQAAISEYRKLIYNSGRQSFWSLGESGGLVAIDSIGGLNGDYVNTPSLNVPGLTGGANESSLSARFNAANTEHVSQIGLIEDYSYIQNTGIFTVEFSCTFDDLNNRIELMGNASQSALDKGIRVAYFGDIGGEMLVQVLHAVNNDYVLQLVSSPNVINDNFKHHFLITADGVNGYIYYDGVPMDSAPIGTLSSGNSTGVFNLATSNAIVNTHRGLLDDVSISANYTTPTELAALVAAWKGTKFYDLAVGRNPFSYHRMDDRSGTVCTDIIRGLNGVYNNTPTLGITGAVANNKAVEFARVTTEYVSAVGGLADYSFIQNTGVFTVELWFYLNDSGGSDQMLLGSTVSTAGKGIFLEFNNTDNSIRFAAERGLAGNPAFDLTSPAGQITALGDWHHLVVTGFGSSVEMFVNGALVQTVAISGLSSGNSTALMHLGAGNNAGAPFTPMDGGLDEVLFYNSGMGAAVVLEHFNARNL